MSDPCRSYCEHGGVCILWGEHATHDSGYCQWDDEHAIPKEEADTIFLATAATMGVSEHAEEILAAQNFIFDTYYNKETSADDEPA